MGKSWHETAYTCGQFDIGKVARYKLDEVDNTSYFSSVQVRYQKRHKFFKTKLVNQSVRRYGYLLCKNWGCQRGLSVVMWHHEYQVEEMAYLLLRHILGDMVIVAGGWLNLMNLVLAVNSPEMPSDALFHREFII